MATHPQLGVRADARANEGADVPAWAIVVAGGSGQRFGDEKQFLTLGARRVVDWAVESALQAGLRVVLVAPEGFAPNEAPVGVSCVVVGGATRTESVRNGLAAVPNEATIVCVHDAARPFASAELFLKVVSAVAAGADGAVPGVEVVDTIKVVSYDESAGVEVVVSTPSRATLRAVQTPQGFDCATLRKAHAYAQQHNLEGTDDATLVEAIGGYVVMVPGEADNKKITTLGDYLQAEQKLANS